MLLSPTAAVLAASVDEVEVESQAGEPE
jgi:hypothetical protein